MEIGIIIISFQDSVNYDNIEIIIYQSFHYSGITIVDNIILLSFFLFIVKLYFLFLIKYVIRLCNRHLGFCIF